MDRRRIEKGKSKEKALTFKWVLFCKNMQKRPFIGAKDSLKELKKIDKTSKQHNGGTKNNILTQ